MGFRTSKFMTGMKSKKAFKTLSVATLAGVATLGATNSTMAQDVSVTPPLVDNTAFTLTPVEQASDNTITKYEYDSVTQTLTPTHYKLELNQMTLGEGDAQKAFQYGKDADGKMTLVDVTGQSDTVADLIVKYSSANVNTQTVNNNDVTALYVESIKKGPSFSYKAGANVEATFVSSKNTSTAYPGGGIISTNRNYILGDISGVFVNNSGRYGSVLSSYNSDIGDISGVFIGNSGGVIKHYTGNYTDESAAASVMGDVSGVFIGNKGGAIVTEAATIGNITGDFLFNDTAITLSSYSVAGDISGNFILNTSTAVNLGGQVGNVNANFISNSDITSDYAEGGGMAAGGKIESITANFYGNKVSSTVDYEMTNNHTNGGVTVNGGGLTCTGGLLNKIKANFFANSVYAEHTSVSGGGVYFQNADVGYLEALFVENNTQSVNAGAYGGAFANTRDSGTSSYGTGLVDTLVADFIGNYAKSEQGSVQGGAVYNRAVISNLKGDFINNHAVSDVGSAIGGAVANGGSVYSYNGGITYNTELVSESNFVENYVESLADAYGGAIGNWSSAGFGYGLYFMMAEIENTGDLISNHASSTNGKALGGAVYTMGIDYDALNDMMGDMGYGDIGDASSLPYIEAVILNEDGTVYKSLALICDYNGNPVLASALEDAIANGTLKSFVKMESEAITRSEFDAMCEQEGMTEEQYFAMMEQMYGGAMVYGDPNDLLNKLPQDALPGTLAAQTVEGVRANKASVTLKNSNILNNYASSQNGKAQGGAIYTEFDTVKIEANDGEAHLISGNYTKNGDVVDDNAVYAKNSKVIFDVTNGSTIQLDDNIDGKNYETFIIGDQQSNFVLNNKIKNSTTHLVDTNLYLTKDSHLDGNNLGLHSGMLNMINNQAGVSALNSLTVTGDTNVNVDVDLKNQTMDRFTASGYGSHSGNLNVTGMNLLSDAVSDKTEIMFAEQGLKDNVTYGGAELPNKEYQTTLYTPIYKYNASYDNREDAGYFVFSRGDKIPVAGGGSSSTGNPSDAFNPAILGSSTSATVGAVGTINQTFNYAFSNADTHMNIPYLERVSMKTRNRYALSVTGDATDMGRFSPLYQPSQEEASVWVKPYATFETVGLKNGPKVHNNTYGTLIGFDTGLQPVKRGWDRVFTGYIGYNGASQRYSGIDSTQNGGLLGGTMTLYKGNFFNATTVSVGASVANNQTMYGNEDFAMLLSGIGNKTGYNFEFKEGKLILQPSMLMSYTFVNTFDYTNAAGVRIDNKPLHALQLAPGVKVIGNLKGGWQPYASVQMVWNLMGESNATANGVKLPEMSIKPYVQYGVGVQKRIKDHFTAYGQAMVQNGGRNGISLTAGFRWALGHDNCKYEKTQRHPEVKTEGSLTSKEILRSAQNDGGKSIRHLEQSERSLTNLAKDSSRVTHVQNDGGRKILKQMTPKQKTLAGGKYQNTSRTAKSGSLRQY